MATLGIIGTAAAWLNLRNAKKELASLEEQQAGLQAAIQTYNFNKWNEFYDKTIKVERDDDPDGVEITTLLRVGNIVGKYMRARASVILTNTSSDRYYIHSVAADIRVQGYPIVIPDAKQEVRVDKWLEPGETKEIQLPGGITSLVDADGNIVLWSLRDAICAICGKSLITSCPKISITPEMCIAAGMDPIEYADVLVRWTTEKGHDLLTGVTRNLAGVLRYCQEAVISF